MGLKCTRFASPSGLHDGDISCAGDLAALARAVLRTPRIARIVRRRSAVLPFPIRGGKLYLYNTNPLLRARYRGATGLKTGYTYAAGRCLVATARRGRTGLGVVLLRSRDPGDAGAAAARPRLPVRARRRRVERRRDRAAQRLPCAAGWSPAARWACWLIVIALRRRVLGRRRARACERSRRRRSEPDAAPPELPRGGRSILPDKPCRRLLRRAAVARAGRARDRHARRGRAAARAPGARRTSGRRRPVLPALELIAVIANADAGEDGMYRSRQPNAVIRRYLRAARRHDMLLAARRPAGPLGLLHRDDAAGALAARARRRARARPRVARHGAATCRAR